jgi:hypothetical protein
VISLYGGIIVIIGVTNAVIFLSSRVYSSVPTNTPNASYFDKLLCVNYARLYLQYTSDYQLDNKHSNHLSATFLNYVSILFLSLSKSSGININSIIIFIYKIFNSRLKTQLHFKDLLTASI